jgi:hypothetical protein
MISRIIILLLAFSLYPHCLCALDLGFAKEDGGVPGAFLNYGAGARSLGMGETFVGVADDASATYWNPAGLTQLKSPEITALYVNLYEQTAYSFASYAMPLKFGTVGIALVNLNSGGFQLRDDFNYDQGIASLNESAAIFSYGKTLWRGESRETTGDRPSRGSLSGGANFKVINQNINSISDTGYGLDLGMFWTPYGATSKCHGIFSPLSVGLSAKNAVAPSIKLQHSADIYPLSTTLGLGYRMLGDKLLLALDVNKTGEQQSKTHFGGEYILLKMFALRVGIGETEFTSGFGVKWQQYSLDYAFAYNDAVNGIENLGISHRLGITIKLDGK